MKKPAKMAKVMKEFGRGKLRSGSKKGPEVTNRKQAIAIGLSEQRKAERTHRADVKKEKIGKSHFRQKVGAAMLAKPDRKIRKMHDRVLGRATMRYGEKQQTRREARSKK